MKSTFDKRYNNTMHISEILKDVMPEIAEKIDIEENKKEKGELYEDRSWMD